MNIYAHIINIMNGKKAPILKRNEEEQLRSLFKEFRYHLVIIVL